MFKSRVLACIALLLLSPQLACGWSEGGHNVIGYMAFRLLTPEKQERFVELIKNHPQFSLEFSAPENVTAAGDLPLWFAGRACYWPDVARGYEEFNRPSWHYQLGACLVIGDPSKLTVPEFPGPLPSGSTLQTQELHIEQAIRLSLSVLDSDASDADKAVALCWVGHLVGDAHQPCHAGSLYSVAFPEGDRGANSIQTTQARNMHALWDQLLGQSFNNGDVKRRAFEIGSDAELQRHLNDARLSSDFMVTEKWLKESRASAKQFVYTAEVLQWAEGDRAEPLELSADYLEKAGRAAQSRALLAADRLAALWEKSL